MNFILFLPLKRLISAFAVCVAMFCTQMPAYAEGIVAKVTSAPIFPNGIVRDVRAGINIFLQNETYPGDLFLDPDVIGYGIPSGGRMEVEMISGYQRDPDIALDERAFLLVTGTPQQGLPAMETGFEVKEGKNENTFVVQPVVEGGLPAENLVSLAPGAGFDPIRQRGVKIIHIGRVSAFVSRGEKGVVEVRIYDGTNAVVASGRGDTNIPHDQRNHNWQRLGVGQILGVARNTLPLPVILYGRNEGLNNQGIEGAGVLSVQQLAELNYEMPDALKVFSGGLILRDRNKNGRLNPAHDEIIGGFTIDAPEGASGYQMLTPLVSEKPFLSVPTERFNERAGKNIGGAIMQTVFIAGDKPGLYKIGYSLLKASNDFENVPGPSFHYTILVE